MAVLGLEAVAGDNGKIDPEDTKFAKELTKELKARAQLSTKYAPLKEHRELVDEKLINNCGLETPGCMAPTGQSMKADVILFGNVKNTKKGWLVTLKLHTVNPPKAYSSDANVFIASDEASGAKLSAWVKERMRKLTGETSTGTVVIRVTGADTGKVFVDDKPVDTLKSGQATLQVDEGRRKITVDVDGFRLWEDTVTVSADKPTNVTPELVKKKPDDITKPNVTDPNTGGGTTGTGDLLLRTGTDGSTKKGNKTTFKIIAGVGLGGAAITGALWAISYYTGPIADFKDTDLSGKSFDRDGDGMNPETLGQNAKVGDGDCKGNFVGNDVGFNSTFKDACSRKKIINYGLIPATTVLGLVGAGALIYVLVSKDDATSERAVGRQKKRNRNLIVTPVVTPDGTGATLRFDW